MDEQLETLVLRVRADTGAFGRDIAKMRDAVDDTLGKGVAGAATQMRDVLGNATRQGRSDFEGLRRVAVTALAEIASAAIRVGAGVGERSANSSPLGALMSGAAMALGAPGRATGGPVVGGRPYLVGERGPELFVPSSTGHIAAGRNERGPVNITVNVAAGPNQVEPSMGRTGRQIARTIAQALAQVDV